MVSFAANASATESISLTMSAQRVPIQSVLAAHSCFAHLPNGESMVLEQLTPTPKVWTRFYQRAFPNGAHCFDVGLRPTVRGAYYFRLKLMLGSKIKATTSSRYVYVFRPDLVHWAGTGNGGVSGPKFTVPTWAPEWQERWTYDCTSFGYDGNFITNITGYGGSAYTLDAGSNELGMQGSGVNHYYDTSAFSIEVNSECDWTDTVVVPGG